MPKKVLLFIPPEEYRRPFPNFGIGTIAAILRERGYAVRIVDGKVADLDPQKMLSYSYYTDNTAGFLVEPIHWDFYEKLLKAWQPDVIGISAATQEIQNGAHFAALAKKELPEVLVAVGNLHAMAIPQETLREFPSFDIVFKGESELAFPDFLDAYFSPQGHWTSFPGIAYRQGETVVENRGFHTVSDLNALPLPARDLFPLPLHELFFKKTRIFGDVPPQGMLMTSRGCPSRCTFCTSPFFRGTKYRAQSPSYVLAEMERLYEQYGVRAFQFWDDIFTVDRARVKAICEGILQKRWKLTFQCYAKVNFIDFDLLSLMAKAGCQAINFGVESGSRRVLKEIHKDITLEQVVEGIKMTRRAGIEPTAGFMLGHPTDDEESVAETVHFALSLIRYGLEYAGFWIAVPYPGTPMFDLCREKLQTANWDAYNPMRLYEANPKPIYEPPGISHAQLLAWQKRGYREFRKKLFQRKIRSPYFFYELAGSARKKLLLKFPLKAPLSPHPVYPSLSSPLFGESK